MEKPPDVGIRRLGIAAWSLLGTILLLGALGWIFVQFWIIIPPVILAIAIVYVLNPVVTALGNRGIARWMGSCLSYLFLIGLFTLFGFLIIPGMSEQGSELVEAFPAIYDEIVEELESLAGRLGINLDLPRHDELGESISSDLDFDQITSVTLGVLEAFLMFLLAPVVAFYLLLDLPTVRRKTLELIPSRHRDEASHVGRQLGTAVGGFLRGQLFVALIVGIMTSFGLWLVNVPFWLLIGMVAGFLNIIPLVGPWVGGALGVLAALGTRDIQTAIWAAVVAVVVQQIDNNFVSPAVLRATVRLHPAGIILGLIAGASIGGFWGILLAVPVMAVVKIVAGHFWRTRVLGQSWAEATEALIDDNPTGETLITRARHRDQGDEVDPPPPPPLADS